MNFWARQIKVSSARGFFLLTAGVLVCLTFVPGCGRREWGGDKKVIVLAFDGMDPRIVREMFAKGKLPHFRKLSLEGDFRDLWSSVPPQSPVAWSNFITGMNPGGHAIFDFIHRDPDTYMPYLSTSKTIPPKKTLKVGDYILPVSKGAVLLKRKGKAFWEYLTEKGIPVTVFKIPSNFPPVECGAESVSGMGTPDLQGSYGIYQYYTSDPEDIPEVPSGGEFNVVTVNDNAVHAKLSGPPNSFKKGAPIIKIDLTARIDPENHVARIEVSGNSLLLREGEWSDWAVLDFKPLAAVPAVKGICRMYMKEVHPEFKLYVSPINVDPKAPALPIDTPKGFAAGIADRVGYFYTQGMPEDTKALTNNTFTTEEFYTQAMMVLDERNRLFDDLFGRFTKGLFFFYYSSTDLGTHIFWHLRDRKHPAYDAEAREKLGDVVEEIYSRMDETVAKAMERMDKNTTLIILSDHGFSPYYKGFNLNTWLLKNGYLVFTRHATKGSLFANVDWSRTKAYALGLNSLYVNLRGREKHGIVEPGPEYDGLVMELKRKLESVTDPENGRRVVKRAHIARDVYSGPYVGKAPDVIVGYDWGYRTAWESALGEVTGDLLKVSTEKWSGDHCGATEIVPGILFSNRKIAMEHPHLYDLAPTIMKEFGIGEPAEMVGRDVFAPPAGGAKSREEGKRMRELGYI